GHHLHRWPPWPTRAETGRRACAPRWHQAAPLAPAPPRTQPADRREAGPAPPHPGHVGAGVGPPVGVRHLTDLRTRPSPTPTFRSVSLSAEVDLRSEEHTSELQSLTNLVC